MAEDARPGFFAAPPGKPGLALFINAGDPPLPVLPELIRMLDESEVDCLELAVPFPDSCTDGPVVRRSASRALAAGTDLRGTLDVVAEARAGLEHLRIAVLADWSHTVKPLGVEDFLGLLGDAGADAVLVHGLPPLLREKYYEAAADRAVPVVTTCYPSSDERTARESARHASAYLYLVAHYGRTGSAPSGGHAGLAPVIDALRASATVPIAVGFGVKGAREIDGVRAAGADAAIIGSAAVSVVERAAAEGTDVVGALAQFVAEIRSGHDGQGSRRAISSSVGKEG
ncbi:tryptophan synthase subunit alpha [Amycolatopsis sp. CA-230715]|uniref:tryptophan synthase subunit alpha n=1 Tax=Amycolatopsis sp. CA-230715 TaxID=2745196 RepID=UPI001C032423|nr:tryptophan synthase subunit alpha [Amycolatopsis sp. CA-230715]QWF84045.1 Tryptophan synthase alpha chain [Amycolatopsis sp. CA-230715]